MSKKALSKRSRILLVGQALVLLATATLAVRYQDVVFHDRGDIDSTRHQNALSILFVGNSMVFYGNVPGQLQAIAGEHGISITFKDISRSGVSLSYSKDTAISEMQSRNYDYVVLQDQAARPFDDVEGFLEDMRILCQVAKESGAQPVIYNPAWASINGQPDEERLSVSTALYRQAAEENDALLVNAADAWIYAYQEIPQVSLYRKHNIHANDAGAFFTACVFAATLFEVHLTRIPQQNRYKGNDALALAEAAWEFTRRG